jgi:hypothetical protein
VNAEGNVVTIPYEQIDCEIRRLVWLVNRFPGIETEFSCASHEDCNPEGYVRFVSASQRDVECLLSSLPFIGWRAGVVANQFQWHAIFVDAVLNDEKGLRYTLRFLGHPQHVQRHLIGEIEKALAAAVNQLAVERPSCSTDESGRNADNERNYL